MNIARNVEAPVRTLLWLSYFAAILCAWVALYVMANDAGLRALCLAPADVIFSLEGFGTVWTMWALMCAAMMLPTLMPTLAAYDDLIASIGAKAGADQLGWLGVAAGYLVTWIVTASVFASAQLVLAGSGALGEEGALSLGWAAALLLMVAGGWQFTRTKAECQAVCLSPTLYFLKNWRAGGAGGLRMGFGMGLYCVVCCWALMALAFVGGVMNLAFMGIATMLMIMEKIPAIGERVSRPVGGMLMLAGVAVMVMPLFGLGE